MGNQENSKIEISQFQFGFYNQDDFIDTVSSYAQSIREDLSSYTTDDLSSFDSRQKATIERLDTHRREELAELERRLKRPTDLYQQVRKYYDRVAILAAEGLSWGKIGDRFHDERIDIGPILGLIEHGINQEWGYHLAQNYAAGHSPKE